jgi:hypothetical protein
MKKSDEWLWGVFLGLTFPTFFCVTFVAIWYYLDGTEAHAFYYAMSGGLAGGVIDAFFLRSWVYRRFLLPWGLLLFFYAWYNVGLYGFFMGFPVFNSLLGPIAGYYCGRRVLALKMADSERDRCKRQLLSVTGILLVLLCFSTGMLAFEGTGVGGMLEYLFGLRFKVTDVMVAGIVVLGSVVLVTFQWWLTKMVFEKTMVYTNK